MTYPVHPNKEPPFPETSPCFHKSDVRKRYSEAMKTNEGDRVRLIFWASLDASAHVRPGDEGVVDLIDDLGTIHVRWDNGANVGMIPGRDRWVVLK